MKFKLLAIPFLVSLYFSGNTFAACGVVSGGTNYTITTDTNSSCVPASGVTNITVDPAVTVSTVNTSAIELIGVSGTIERLLNQGTITSTLVAGIYAGWPSNAPITINTLENTLNSSITGRFGVYVDSYANIGLVKNYGTISANLYSAIFVDKYNSTDFGRITRIDNYGTLTQGNAATGGVIANYGAIQEINNYQTIYSQGDYGISNIGTIAVLNNAQGAGNISGALTYTGALPGAYNIIIKDADTFGRLAATSATGPTVFGISASSATGSSILKTYTSVLAGVTNTALGISGTSLLNGLSNGYRYNLVETGAGTNIWDLTILLAPAPIPAGPSTANTQASMQNTAQALQGTYTLQNSVLANSFSYDCNEFGANGVCISAGGRNTAVSAANGLNNTSGLLIAAYRPHMNYRVGAYVDQNLSVNNAGSTVNLGNNTPLIGLFGAWNERLDGTGTEVKVSMAYGQKNTTVTRSVVGTGSTASEAGTGGSQLNSQGAQVLAKYGFGVAENVIVSPYAGIRYTQNNMGGYTEGASSSVTAPLTYSALNTNATTALAGVGASYRFIPRATVFASAGVETDTNTANGSYSATGVSGLTAVNFNANPVKTRPTAMVGASYDVAKNQRLGVTGIYRQEPYQAVSTTTVMATYTVGL